MNSEFIIASEIFYGLANSGLADQVEISYRRSDATFLFRLERVDPLTKQLFTMVHGESSFQLSKMLLNSSLLVDCILSKWVHAYERSNN